MAKRTILRASFLLLALLMCITPCVSADDSTDKTNDVEQTAEAAPAPAPSPEPSSDPIPTESTPTAAAKPTPVPTARPSEPPEPSDAPAVEPTPDPVPMPSPEPTPDASPGSTKSPEPAETLNPTSTPEPDATLTPEPDATLTPEPEQTPVPSPAPSLAPSPTPEPAASPAPQGDDSEDAQAGHGDGSGLRLTPNKPRLDWTGVVPADGGMPIPRLYQYDYRTVLCRYDGIPRSVSTSGCNVTCVAMVAAYLTNEKHSPEKLFSWALKHDLYYGNGLGHSAMSKVAANCGVSGKWIGRDEGAVIEALKAGKPVIAHMGPGLFTRRGHYIVLRGVTEDGKILVNDPNSAYRSGLAYPMRTILKEARNNTPFMVCDEK